MARVAFCQDVLVEYMGFMCISAVLKEAGHTVDVFFDNQTNEEKFLREVAAFRPDVVGFSILSPSAPWALRTAKRVKDATGAIIVFGNVHAIFRPDIVEDEGVDIVCLGEGEYCMRELCAALDRGEDYSRIEGFWVKTRDGVVRNPARRDLVVMDNLPYHDRQLYDKYVFFRRSPYLRVMTGRGCPFSCTFCSNTPLKDHFGDGGAYIRKMSPERAIAEIEHTLRNHAARVKTVFFIDEVLWVKNQWLRDFLPLYRDRVGIPFLANFRFGPIEESDIRLLAQAGAWGVAVSVETADEEQRRNLFHKNVSNDHVIQVTDWLRKYGVEFGLSAFFGLPGETFEEQVKRLEFYRRVNPFYLWTTFFQPYPGLPLSEHEEVQKYLPPGKDFPVTLHHEMYLDIPDRDRLANLKKVYYLCMKFPRLQPLLVRLCNYRIPLLFDFLFLLHFAYYTFRVEGVSVFQFLMHLRTFALHPLRRGLSTRGRPSPEPHVAVTAKPGPTED
ncbi:MAG: B12-binding domain-containing radical SAM protein [Candidatus Hydrogenedentes bacterium]|nr:B12-binding domain-containing radical SAM protein [Candidatus Hydrogenedentota bacterium]